MEKFEEERELPECPHCGKEMLPMDEYGSSECDCLALEKSISKSMQEA